MSDSPKSNQLPDQVTVIFDGSCGFCTRTARWLRSLDRNGRVITLPFQHPGVPAQFGLTTADCEAAAWAIAPGLPPQRGAAAVMLALAIAMENRLDWLIYQLPVFRQILDAAYTLVARVRHRLPGDQPYCEQFPGACGSG